MQKARYGFRPGFPHDCSDYASYACCITSQTKIKGDELTYARAPIPSPEGRFVPTLTWKRAK